MLLFRWNVYVMSMPSTNTIPIMLRCTQIFRTLRHDRRLHSAIVITPVDGSITSPLPVIADYMSLGRWLCYDFFLLQIVFKPFVKRFWILFHWRSISSSTSKGRRSFEDFFHAVHATRSWLGVLPVEICIPG